MTSRCDTGTAQAQALLEATRLSEHPHCLFCGRKNPLGFKLDFRVRKQGSVSATFPCGHLFQSYPAMLHGGVTSALLDAAMTNCLFSMGIAAVTGELVVRYMIPVEVDCGAEVVATLEKSSPPLFYLSAELKQHERVVARASAKFMHRRSGRGVW